MAIQKKRIPNHLKRENNIIAKGDALPTLFPEKPTTPRGERFTPRDAQGKKYQSARKARLLYAKQWLWQYFPKTIWRKMKYKEEHGTNPPPLPVLDEAVAWEQIKALYAQHKAEKGEAVTRFALADVRDAFEQHITRKSYLQKKARGAPLVNDKHEFINEHREVVKSPVYRAGESLSATYDANGKPVGNVTLTAAVAARRWVYILNQTKKDKSLNPHQVIAQQRKEARQAVHQAKMKYFEDNRDEVKAARHARREEGRQKYLEELQQEAMQTHNWPPVLLHAKRCGAFQAKYKNKDGTVKHYARVTDEAYLDENRALSLMFGDAVANPMIPRHLFDKAAEAFAEYKARQKARNKPKKENVNIPQKASLQNRNSYYNPSTDNYPLSDKRLVAEPDEVIDFEKRQPESNENRDAVTLASGNKVKVVTKKKRTIVKPDDDGEVNGNR